MAKKKKAPTKAVGAALDDGVGKIRPGMTLQALLRTDTIRKRFADVLGKKAPGFASSILSAVSANPTLATCDPMSVISASMIAATLDLPINPSLGLAHIVPYKGKATFQIGWKGIYQLAMRSGQYLTVNISTVYDGELVKRNKFTGTMELDEEGKKSDKIIGHLLYFKLLNGFEKYFYMTHEEMEAHGKRYSQSYKKGGGVWVENFKAMADKTVAKLGISKFGPMSIAMEKAFVADQAEIEEDGAASYLDNPPDPVADAKPAEKEKLPERDINEEPGEKNQLGEEPF